MLRRRLGRGKIDSLVPPHEQDRGEHERDADAFPAVSFSPYTTIEINNGTAMQRLRTSQLVEIFPYRRLAWNAKSASDAAAPAAAPIPSTLAASANRAVKRDRVRRRQHGGPQQQQHRDHARPTGRMVGHLVQDAEKTESDQRSEKKRYPLATLASVA